MQNIEAGFAAKPRIAVCLAAYNGVRHLRQQLDSIWSQDRVCVTVFVSVDVSSDGTEQWLNEYGAINTQCVLLPMGERFGGAAQNFFRLLREVDFSEFEYVAFADQDDIWLPAKLHRAVQRLKESGAQGYSSDVIAFWEDGRTRLVRKAYAQRKWDYLFESAGPGCTFVLQKGLAAEVQAFLRNHIDATRSVGLHDWFCYAFARAGGYRWYIDAQANMLYRQHGANQVGVNVGWRAFLWRVGQVLNGWGLDQARLIGMLVMPEQDPFMAKWVGGGRAAVWNLLWHANACRRRPLDRVWFAISCIALCVVGWK